MRFKGGQPDGLSAVKGPEKAVACGCVSKTIEAEESKAGKVCIVTGESLEIRRNSVLIQKLRARVIIRERIREN